MSIDPIGSYYSTNIEPRCVRTVLAQSDAVNVTPIIGGTAALSGLFSAGSLITNLTIGPGHSALTGPYTVSAIGNNAALTADLGSFQVFNLAPGVGTLATVLTTIGPQLGVTLPQDSWLQVTGTGVVPTLVVSYLS